MIIREGDEGDRFYIVVEGDADGHTGWDGTRSSDAGDYFGEIALLRDTARTATVTAQTPSSSTHSTGRTSSLP